MNSRVPSLQVMVHGQASGICWHSSLIASQSGGRFSKFCGIQLLRIWNVDIPLTLPSFQADGNLNEVREKLRIFGVRQLRIEAKDDDRLGLVV